MKKQKECRRHKWIPFLGRVGKKNVPTAVFSCLNCGEMKVGIHTIRMSRFRLDMGNLPIKSVSEIVLQEAPPTDHTVSGTIVNMTYGESLVPGDVVFFKSDGCVWKADANAAGLYPAMGVALETYSSGSHKVLLEGIIRDDTWTWTVGGVIYLDTAAGAMTQTQPNVEDDVIQVLGIATHADRILFQPSPNYTTVLPLPPTFTFKVVYAAGGTFTLPIAGGGAGYAHNFTVSWGDGTPDSTITAYNDGDAVHTYAGAGTYTVTMTGTCEWFAFNAGGNASKVTELVSFTGDMGFKVLNFNGCTALTTIVPLGTMASLTTCESLFLTCSALSSIPSGLFDGCTAVTTFSAAFNATALASIPADLFLHNTLVTSFYQTFQYCDFTSIPTDIFRYNTAVTDFSYVFNGCTSLTSLPTDIFRYNTAVTDFSYVFNGCTSLTSLPTDIFRYNTAVTTFASCLRDSTSLATVPANLFKYNAAVTSFGWAFMDCDKLQQHATIFYAAGESATRFHDKSVSFSSCFSRTSFTGTQGTAPDLWNCDFGTGTPTKTNCWAGAGNSLTSLTNYNSIPLAWGGTYVPLGVWSAGGNLATARMGLAGCGTQTAGLSFGGYTSVASAVTEEYDGTSWSSGGALATASAYLGGCGTQTAGLSFGGGTGTGTYYVASEEYNGTSWGAGGNMAHARDYLAGAGTQTAGLSFSGASQQKYTEEYNGTSWSAGGDLTAGRAGPAGCGTQTAGLCCGGSAGTHTASTEEYDGTSWSAGGNLANSRMSLAGCGTQTAGLSFGGSDDSGRVVFTEEYDGTSWNAGGNLATAKNYLAGCGTQTAGLSFGGYISYSLSAVTEEYTK